MTSEEWIANIPSEQDRKYAREAVSAAIESEREGEIVIYSGLCKVGEADFEVRKGRGDEDSVVLVPVPYKLIKGKRMEIIARPTKAKETGL